jgi:hypothetical protein
MSADDALAKPEPQALPPAPLAVVEWLLNGASEQQIREAMAHRYPTVDPGETMANVQRQLQAAGRPNQDAVRGWALLAYRKLYQQMLSVGDYDGCRKVIKEITGLV